MFTGYRLYLMCFFCSSCEVWLFHSLFSYKNCEGFICVWSETRQKCRVFAVNNIFITYHQCVDRVINLSQWLNSTWQFWLSTPPQSIIVIQILVSISGPGFWCACIQSINAHVIKKKSQTHPQAVPGSRWRRWLSAASPHRWTHRAGRAQSDHTNTEHTSVRGGYSFTACVCVRTRGRTQSSALWNISPLSALCAAAVWVPSSSADSDSQRKTSSREGRQRMPLLWQRVARCFLRVFVFVGRKARGGGEPSRSLVGCSSLRITKHMRLRRLVQWTKPLFQLARRSTTQHGVPSPAFKYAWTWTGRQNKIALSVPRAFTHPPSLDRFSSRHFCQLGCPSRIILGLLIDFF